MPSFPRQCFVVITIIGTMTPSDSLSVHPPFHLLAYRFLFTPRVELPRRVSPVTLITFLAYRSLYPEGFFNAALSSSSHLPWSSPTCARVDFPLSFYRRSLLTRRQDSLDVTVCYFASTSLEATLSQGFNLRISPPAACQLPSALTLTWVELSSTSN